MVLALSIHPGGSYTLGQSVQVVGKAAAEQQTNAREDV
jgi:hypothetical protein